MRQVKPIRHEGRRGTGAIFVREQFGYPFRRRLPCSNMHQTANDIAHHVMQKTIGPEIEHQIVSPLGNTGQAHFLFWRFGLAFGRAKRGKIVPSQQLRGSLLHA